MAIQYVDDNGKVDVEKSDLKIAGFTVAGWYFWDEGYLLHGPYDSEKVAKQKEDEYGEWLNG